MKFVLVSACLAVLGSVSTAIADNPLIAPVYNYDLTKFVAWLEDVTRENEIPGVALAIVSREGIMYMQTWGVRNIDSREAINTDSVFRIASMSKTFAGTAAALLVDQKYQSWDTPLTEMFPTMKLGTRRSSEAITLKHIVSHYSGLMPH